MKQIIILFVALFISSSLSAKSKQEIVREFCNLKVHSGNLNKKPKLLLLAGLPGSGKSTVKKRLTQLNLISFSEYVSIDSDEFIVELDSYKALMAQGETLRAVNENQSTAVEIRSETINCARDKKVNIIIDGTLVSQRSTNKLIAEFRAHGYTPWILYVSVDPKEAWRRVKYREQTEKRGVDESYFNFVVKTLPASIESYINNKILTVKIENTMGDPVLKRIALKNGNIKPNLPINPSNSRELGRLFSTINMELWKSK